MEHNKPNNNFNTFVSLIEEISPKRYSVILVVPVIFLILGYLIWNIYLYTFGFIDNELIRGTFILVGFFFSLFTFNTLCRFNTFKR